MKWKWLLPLALVALAAGGGAFAWWYLHPRTAAAAFESASKEEVRLAERISLNKQSTAPDALAQARIEGKIRENWDKVLKDWPGTPEAERAAYRLLLREIAAAPDPAERLKLIDAFLAAHPEHEEKKALLWQKAELQRDDLKDPLGAIATFGEIEKAFAGDPIGPKAALASAKIYESIREHGTAAEAYKKLAEKYPASQEAAEAQMRRASLLEEKLDKKREAAEVYDKVAKSSPGSASGQMAARRRQKLLGELGQGEQDKYYKETYRVEERNPFAISKEELNSPAMKRLRSQGFDIARYDLYVKLHPDTSALEAKAALHGKLEHNLTEPLMLQLNPAIDVEKAALEGAGDLKFERRGPYLEFVLPAGAGASGRELNLTLDYHGSVGTWFGDTLTTVGASLRTEAKWYPQTHFGDAFAQHVTIDCPEDYRAIAQGVETETGPPPGVAPLEKGWKRFSYEQTEPSQFLTVALGHFERRQFKGPHDLAMEIDLLPEHAKSIDDLQKTMTEAVKVYEEIYGPFPYKRLAAAESATFPGGYGAATLILVGSIGFKDPGPPAKFLAHEIAHQWWGNLVSLDLTEDSIPWLSEAFATYSDAIYTERTAGRPPFLNQIRTMGNFYRENMLSFQDRPIAETLWDSPMYRSLMYEKGALVLHGLRRELGDEKFFALLRGFIDSHRFKIVKIKDFADAASAIAGKDMTWYFDQMLRRTGYARIQIKEAKATAAGGAWSLDLDLAQQAPPYRMTMDVAIELAGAGTERKVVEVMGETAHTTFQLPGRPAKVRLDPDSWHLLDARDEMIEKAILAPAN